MRVRSLSVVAVLGAVVLHTRPASATFSPYMAAVSAGGGVSDFVRSSYRADTSVAGAWDVRALIGTRTPLAFELGYEGTALQVFDPIGSSPAMTSTVVDGQLRLNLSLWRLQPFAAAGLGWINFHSFGRDEAPVASREFNHNDNGLLFPFTGGVAAYIGEHAMLDARFEYRLALKADISPVINQRPDTWMALLRAGYAF